MDVGAIFALVEKGLMVVSLAIQAGQTAEPALKALKDIVVGAQQGDVTDQQLADTENLLDQMIAEFNEPLEPPQGATNADDN